MTHRDSAAEFVHRIWPAEPSALAGIRRAVRGWLAPLHLTAEAEDDLVLAVSEAGSNVIDHAYSTPEVAAGIELFFWTEPAVLSIQIVDHGRWQPPGPHSAGNGTGINLMQRLVDFVMIRYDARGTRVLLRHSLPGIERPSPHATPAPSKTP